MILWEHWKELMQYVRCAKTHKGNIKAEIRNTTFFAYFPTM